MKMKYSVLVAISLLVVSCQSVSIEDVDRNQEITIEAVFGDDNATKTVRNESDGKIYWKPGDQINVFFGSETGVFTSSNTENVAKASFTGSITISSVIGLNEGEEDANCLWGLYPYNSSATFDGTHVNTTLSNAQTGIAGTFADDLYITLAKSNSFLMSFNNVLSGIKFSLVKEGITSIEFKGNNGEPLTGNLQLSYDSNTGKPTSSITGNAQTVITLTPEGEAFETGKNYYIVFNPVTLSSGFTMTFYTATQKASFVYSSSMTFSRNVFKSRANIDSGLEYVSIPDAVDFGLSVKWANYNLGATKPEEYGDEYAWGEVITRKSSNWRNYSLCNHSDISYDESPDFYIGDINQTLLQKYCLSQDYGYPDNRLNLRLDDDAASVQWGEGWRIPTKAEWDELFHNTNSTYVENYLNSGMSGILLTGRLKGFTDKQIFLPMKPSNINDYQCYWSSTLSNIGNSCYAASAIFSRTQPIHDSSWERTALWAIRPILYTEGSNKISGITINQNSITLLESESTNLTATVRHTEGAVNQAYVEWQSSDKDIAYVNSNGVVTALSEGTAEITATTYGGEYKAICTVTVNKSDLPTPQPVDLGLSVVWASFNLGASDVTKMGDSFAFAETKIKTYYKWSNYTFFDLDTRDISKDFTYSSSNDAASVRWGEGWRIPTHAEWDELENSDNCTWSYMYNYNRTGVSGYLITSKKDGFVGNSIFLPVNSSGNAGYWSSTILAWMVPIKAYYTQIYSSNSVNTSFYGYLFEGFNIRPVKKK